MSPPFSISENPFTQLVAASKEIIEDRTETNLVNLRRIIYLTIMNALNYEEAVHKLLKVQLQEGQEVCSMINVNDAGLIRANLPAD